VPKILEEMAENLRPENPTGLPVGDWAGRDFAISTERGGDTGEVMGNGVTCDRQVLSYSSTFLPWLDLDFFQPNIFFHPFSLREFLGLVPGETPWKPISHVGGVVGGVMGSRAELEGELALSSAKAASGAPVDLMRAAESCDWRDGCTRVDADWNDTASGAKPSSAEVASWASELDDPLVCWER
jgi:hypothetical protein